MGCICAFFRKDDEGAIISKQIDAELKKSRNSESNQVKLLLLGSGESGKSTIIKQMRIIHKNGYNESERQDFIKIIYLNIITSMQALVKAMETLEIEYINEANVKNAEQVKSYEISAPDKIDENLWVMLKELWEDEGVKNCYQRRNEFQLIDSCKYFFDQLESVQKPGYIPSIQDILRSRSQTTGIHEYDFQLKYLSIKIIDVGGQKSERKKWLRCFDNVLSVLYIVAISEYDQMLFESEELNRLSEAHALFKKIVTSKWFENSTFIMFLNKTDLLEEKIMYSNLEDHFPEYIGPKRDAEKAKAFIKGLFTENYEDRTIYSHFTCATNTENVRAVFASVQDSIRQKMHDEFSIN